LETVFREWVHQQIGLNQCIAALQEMKNTWNVVHSGPLSYFWQRPDLERLIPSSDTLYFNLWDMLATWHSNVCQFDRNGIAKETSACSLWGLQVIQNVRNHMASAQILLLWETIGSQSSWTAYERPWRIPMVRECLNSLMFSCDKSGYFRLSIFIKWPRFLDACRCWKRTDRFQFQLFISFSSRFQKSFEVPCGFIRWISAW
jgi:hypothetical protein